MQSKTHSQTLANTTTIYWVRGGRTLVSNQQTKPSTCITNERKTVDFCLTYLGSSQILYNGCLEKEPDLKLVVGEWGFKWCSDVKDSYAYHFNIKDPAD